ncbi:hypothetical protein P5704_028080 (plasmid) [Pseudomonas sp. FeN3W]|nr:hypothetical protein P5704_028080 [Pseudomonas sp. FeN3W]
MNALALSAKLKEIYQPFVELGCNIDLELARSLFKEAEDNCRIAEDCGVNTGRIKQNIATSVFEPLLRDISLVAHFLPDLLVHLPWMRTMCQIPYKHTDLEASTFRYVLESYRVNLLNGDDLCSFMQKLDVYYLNNRHELYLQEFMKLMYVLDDELLNAEVLHSLLRNSNVLAEACIEMPNSLLSEDAMESYFRTIKSACVKVGTKAILKYEVLEKLRVNALLNGYPKLIDDVLIQTWDETSIYNFYRSTDLYPSADAWLASIKSASTNLQRNAVIIAAISLYVNHFIDLDIEMVCQNAVNDNFKLETKIIGDLISDCAVSTNDRFSRFAVAYIDACRAHGVVKRAFEHFDEMGIDPKELRIKGASQHLAAHEFGI